MPIEQKDKINEYYGEQFLKMSIETAHDLSRGIYDKYMIWDNRFNGLFRQEEYHVTFTSPIHSITFRYRGRLFSTWFTRACTPKCVLARRRGAP